MNVRATSIIFAVILTVLASFGILLTYTRQRGGEDALFPTLGRADVKIEAVTLKPKDHAEITLVKEAEQWYLTRGGQKTKVETFRVNELINAVKNAKRSDEFVPNEDVAQFGLTSPMATVTLKGKDLYRTHEWTLTLGKDSPDNFLTYVGTSDRPDKAYAVAKSSIKNLLIKEANGLRNTRIFDFVETLVTELNLRKDKSELALKRGEDGIWRFVKPELGFASFDDKEGPADEKAETGVRALLRVLGAMRVQNDSDFVPLGEPLSNYGLEEGQEWLRFEVAEKDRKHTFIAGKRVGNAPRFYARLTSDQGAFQIEARQFEAIDKAIARPESVRSKDLAALENAKLDFITLKQGKREVSLSRSEKFVWQVQVDQGERADASQPAVDQLLEAVRGRNSITAFVDVSGDEAKKYDSDAGFDEPAAQIRVYTGGYDKESKKLKQDAKPAVSLVLGKADDKGVQVKRTLADGTVSRIRLEPSMRDKLIPEPGVDIAFLERSLPVVQLPDVTGLVLHKGSEQLELKREGEGKDAKWVIKDPSEPKGHKPADAAKVEKLLDALKELSPEKWVRRIDGPEDLDALGLKSPGLSATLIVKKERIPPAGITSLLAQWRGTAVAGVYGAVAAALAHAEFDAGERVTLSIGNEADKGAYARHSAKPLAFQVGSDLVSLLKTADLRDQSWITRAHPAFLASQLATASLRSLLIASPLLQGEVLSLDPAKVEEVKLVLRRPEEVRSLKFQRKDRTWTDAAGLQEFQVDSERVQRVVEALGRLAGGRIVVLTGGPRADHKLGAKDALLRIDFTVAASEPVELAIGAKFGDQAYFAHSSASPEMVFLVPASTVDPILRGGVGYFSKSTNLASE